MMALLKNKQTTKQQQQKKQQQKNKLLKVFLLQKERSSRALLCTITGKRCRRSTPSILWLTLACHIMLQPTTLTLVFHVVLRNYSPHHPNDNHHSTAALPSQRGLSWLVKELVQRKRLNNKPLTWLLFGIFHSGCTSSFYCTQRSPGHMGIFHWHFYSSKINWESKAQREYTVQKLPEKSNPEL